MWVPVCLCVGAEAPVILQQGISGSQQGVIIFDVQLMLTHEKVEVLGSEIVQNLLKLSVPV